jgi:serine/threonine-protein kinase
MSDVTVFNGRYELHRRLGRGGMAEVYLARDLQLDRPVAVKVLFPEFATDPSFVARFRREAQAAAKLNHPNIVGVFDWGEEQGTYFIVMEYVEGRSLAEILRNEGPMPPDRAVDVATDIAAALGFAHRNGVVHRDIKPGNILVTPAGMVKVADWGIGRALDAADENLTQTGAVMGTATYFSPEQAQGLSLDPRSDLYSVGVVLYELLTGRPPFTGDSPVAIAYKHVQQPPRPPRSVNLDIPAELEAIVLQLLEKDPHDRYESAEDLRADLRRYREGFRVHAMDRAAAAGAGLAAATSVVPASAATAATRVVPAGYSDGTRMVPMDELPRDYAPPPQRRSSAFLVVLILLLLLLAGLLFALAKVLGVGDSSETVTQVEVPRVTGLSEADARAQLTAAGFTVELGEPKEVADPNQVGLVLEQTPQAGIKADEGSTVTIVVGSQNLLEMPDLAGSTPDLAEQQLRALGFTGPIQQQPEDSDEVPEGQIIRSDPDKGQQVAATSTITLIVSSGPPQVAVPNVATLTESDAVDAVEAAELVPQVRQEASADVDQGRVIRTEPAAATMVDKGSTVIIVVSSGDPQATVPPVIGLDEAAATQAIEDAGFQVVVQTTIVLPGDPNDGKVVDQDPSGNTQATVGSTVTITVAHADAGD